MKQRNLNIDSIPALNKSFIPQDLKDKVGILYRRMENYYVRYQNKKTKLNKDINKFEKCYFCIHKNGLLLPFAKVFIENGIVDYKVVKRHQKALNLTPELAEYLTIKYLYTPTVSMEFDCIFSISNIDAHAHVLEHEVSYNNEHEFVCIQYKFDSGELCLKNLAKYANNTIPVEPVHVLPDGIVIIE